MRKPVVTNPLDELVGYAMRRISAAGMESLARDLSVVDLRPVEASALLLISANPRVRPVEVGRQLGMQRANVTPLLAALESRGLLGREALDGRSHGLILTAAGREACQSAFDIMTAHDMRMLDRLQPSQIVLFRHLLRLLRAGSP